MADIHKHRANYSAYNVHAIPIMQINKYSAWEEYLDFLQLRLDFIHFPRNSPHPAQLFQSCEHPLQEILQNKIKPHVSWAVDEDQRFVLQYILIKCFNNDKVTLYDGCLVWDGHSPGWCKLSLIKDSGFRCDCFHSFSFLIWNHFLYWPLHSDRPLNTSMMHSSCHCSCHNSSDPYTVFVNILFKFFWRVMFCVGYR